MSKSSVRVPARSEVFDSPLADDVTKVYRDLGGVLDVPPLKLLKWDLSFDEIAIELDEYLHFNRYRALTLTSSGYEQLPSFPLSDYQRYCRTREPECLKAGGWGGRWKNPSCEKQFGMSSPARDLSGAGSSRWKQRAYYDFVKDLSPLTAGTTVVRIAVWDRLRDSRGERFVHEMLTTPTVDTDAALVELVRSRTWHP